MEKNLLQKLANHIHKASPMTPMSVIHLNIYHAVSEMLCFHRVRIDFSPIEKPFPNVYAINFMRSGGGKDRVLNHIKQCITFYKNKEAISDAIYKRNIDDIEEVTKQLVKNKELKESSVKKYKDDNAPRQITTNTSNGTIEGIVSMRETMFDNAIGHVNFSHSEFANFISTNVDSAVLLNFFVEVYEGKNEPKMIKGNKRCRAIDGVPNTMFAFSSIHGLVDNDKANDKFKSFLRSGFARRCFLSFPTHSDFGDPVDHSEDFEEFEEELYNEMLEIQEEFTELEKIITKFNENFMFCDPKFIKITKEAKKIYKKYEYICSSKKVLNEDILETEESTRSWKTLKLSGVLALIINKSLIIDEDIMKLAIQISDGFGKQTSKFIDEVENDYVKKVFNYIVDNGESTQTQISRMSNIFGRRFNDKKLLTETFDLLDDYATFMGMKLIIGKTSRGSGKTYTIEKLPDHEPVKEDITVKYSVQDTKEDNDTSARPKEISFNRFHEVTGSNTKYLSAHFKNDYRKTTNYEIGHNLIILDIDNDKGKELKIEEAKKIFGEFKCLIATTKRHNIEEKGFVDRYRIIFPTKEFTFNDEKRFKRIMNNIIKEFSLHDYVDIPAAGKIALAYSCNNGKYWYSEGPKLLNWKVFDYGEEKQVYIPKTHYIGEKQNVIKEQRFIIPNGDSVGWEHFEYLKSSATSPCFCTNHEDTRPSAFVGRHINNGSLFMKCDVCDTLYFNS